MESAREIAAARSRSYWLLSRLFLEQPDAGLLRDLLPAPDAPAEARCGEPASVLFASARAALESPERLTALQVEYTRLLGSASKMSGAPEPYESVARDGRLFGPSAEAVSAAYAEAGHPELVHDAGPPDHVGVELRFLALLCYHEMQALDAGDETQAANWLERERAFLDSHVLPWAPSLCDKLLKVTAHPFYTAVASLTTDVLVADREQAFCNLKELGKI